MRGVVFPVGSSSVLFFGTQGTGAAYDPLHGLVYVSQQYGNGADPVIHVFALA